MSVTDKGALAEAQKQQPSLAVESQHPLAAIAAIAIVILSIICGLATYLVLTGLAPVKPNRELIAGLMAANLLLVSLMAGMIGWQAWKLVRARRRNTAGAGLHIRMVGLFSLIAALPAIIVALFATVTLSRGLDTWFSDRTRSVVDSSVAVAQSYIRETAERIRDDVVSISSDLNQQRQLFDADQQAFVKRVATHAALRGLSAVYVIDRARKYLDVSVTANSRIQFKPPKEDAFEKAENGELVIIAPGEDPFIRALIKLNAYDGRYLYISRLVDAQVLKQLEKARESKLEFDQMLNQRQGVQLTFALVYAGVALIFLLSAIWLGLWFADRLVEPIINLVNASRRVSQGDLDAKVPAHAGPGDLSTLGRTFNQMTDKLKSQHNDLISANHQLDERRRFTEAMLAGVSAGVVGTDPSGRIDLVNRSAIQLLEMQAETLIGKMMKDAIAPFASLIDQASLKPSGTAEGQVSIKIANEERSFFVRVTTEKSDQTTHGFVVTFDDITELVSAQRNSAWADIARRIAHEIKNPLTPIQLSAERLKRKYSKEIQTDPQIFEQCTNTIIRQVGDIGRMVDEFSSFARMPSAVLEDQDLAQVVKEATILQRVTSNDVEIEVNIPDHPVMLSIDRRLVSQAVTNLVKNAREAIEIRQKDEPQSRGHIKVEIDDAFAQVSVNVTDNGVGLPAENRHRLTEPYMTTREKGTGLGLAIVKRIMEEHGGRLILQDAPVNGGQRRGAQARLVFNRAAVTTEIQHPAAS
ncbi:MAG TPA: PAS domain-containing sensor histidine kinase [Aestuariivirgaceae bacterium]|jgi:two-component system nitrogen regulation sensor histidine kinase NtrY